MRRLAASLCAAVVAIGFALPVPAEAVGHLPIDGFWTGDLTARVKMKFTKSGIPFTAPANLDLGTTDEVTMLAVLNNNFAIFLADAWPDWPVNIYPRGAQIRFHDYDMANPAGTDAGTMLWAQGFMASASSGEGVTGLAVTNAKAAGWVRARTDASSVLMRQNGPVVGSGNYRGTTTVAFAR